MKLNDRSSMIKLLFSCTILVAVFLQCTHSAPAPEPAPASTLDKAEALEIVPVYDQVSNIFNQYDL